MGKGTVSAGATRLGVVHTLWEGPCLDDAPEAQAMAGGHGVVVGGNGHGDAKDGPHTNGGCNVQQVEVDHLQVATVGVYTLGACLLCCLLPMTLHTL